MGIFLKDVQSAINRACTVTVAQKHLDQPSGQVGCDLAEGHHLPGAGRTLDFKGVAVKMIEFLQGFDKQVVYRKPDRPTPVGIAAEKSAFGLRRLVADGVGLAIHVEFVWMFLVKFGNRADAVL